MKKTIIILTAIICIVAMVSCEKPMTQQQRYADMASHITEFNYKGVDVCCIRIVIPTRVMAVSPTIPIARATRN